MNDIDYEKIRQFEKNRTTKVGYGAKLYPYCSLIVALRLCEWKYRDIIEYLYDIGEINILLTAHKIDNVKLSKLVAGWRTKDLINYDEVEKEKKLILGGSGKKTENRLMDNKEINIFRTKLRNFLVSYSKLAGRAISGASELRELETYFEQYKNVSDDMEFLANECLAQRNAFISQ